MRDAGLVARVCELEGRTWFYRPEPLSEVVGPSTCAVIVVSYFGFVPSLPPGTPVTVPRTYVDFVVTEFGAAELRGRTVQERAAALCEIAHPEFRDELRDHAKRLYGLGAG